MKKQKVYSTWLFVLVAGMMVATAKNVFATKDGTGKPAMDIFA